MTVVFHSAVEDHLKEVCLNFSTMQQDKRPQARKMSGYKFR